MPSLETLAIVFTAGFITAFATGVGALPFFFFESISDSRNVLLWGLASGIMLSASLFGLIGEGLAVGTPLEILTGMGAGVLLLLVVRGALMASDIDPRTYEEADFKNLVLILGILTVHSFPEGIAIGVSFAELGLEGGAQVFGIAVPLLAIFMTIAISIHNIPEGTAISIPLKSMGVSNWKMVWWAIFSSLPQPVGAVIAFTFVRIARDLLPFGFGFAAGAMIFLVVTEFIPEALDTGAELPGRGLRELVAGITIGVAIMLPLAFI
jgi:zinc transporter, ZIP family